MVLYALLVKTLSLGNYEYNKIHKTVKNIDFYVKFHKVINSGSGPCLDTIGTWQVIGIITPIYRRYIGQYHGIICLWPVHMPTITQAFKTVYTLVAGSCGGPVVPILMAHF